MKNITSLLLLKNIVALLLCLLTSNYIHGQKSYLPSPVDQEGGGELPNNIWKTIDMFSGENIVFQITKNHRGTGIAKYNDDDSYWYFYQSSIYLRGELGFLLRGTGDTIGSIETVTEYLNDSLASAEADNFTGPHPTYSVSGGAGTFHIEFQKGSSDKLYSIWVNNEGGAALFTDFSAGGSSGVLQRTAAPVNIAGEISYIKISSNQPNTREEILKFWWTGYEPVTIDTAYVNSDGESITVTLSRAITSAFIPFTDFTINGQTIIDGSIDVAQKEITFNLQDIIYKGTTGLTLSYSPTTTTLYGVDHRTEEGGIERPFIETNVPINTIIAPPRPIEVVGSPSTNSEGDTIILDFNVEMATVTQPSGSLGFVTSTGNTISKVEVNPNQTTQLWLIVDVAFVNTDVIFLNYVNSGTDIQSTDGAVLSDFDNMFIINSVTGAPPVSYLFIANYRGDTVFLTTSQDIDAATIATDQKDFFTLMIEGTSASVEDVLLIGNNVIALAIDTVLENTFQQVTVSYNGEGTITSVDGIPMLAFEDRPVDISNTPGKAPMFLSSTTNKIGDSVIVFFDSELELIPVGVEEDFLIRLTNINGETVDTLQAGDINTITSANEILYIKLDATLIHKDHTIELKYEGASSQDKEIKNTDRGVLKGFSWMEVSNVLPGAGFLPDSVTVSSDGFIIYIHAPKVMKDTVYSQTSPTLNNFTILVNNTTVNVTSIYRKNNDESTLMLYIPQKIKYEDKVVVANLLDANSEIITSADGGIMKSFNMEAINKAQGIAPVIAGDVYTEETGRKIIIPLDKPIVEVGASTSPFTAFVSSLNESTQKYEDPQSRNFLNVNVVDETYLELTIERRLLYTDQVTLQYINGEIKTNNNGYLQNFIDLPVINNSPQEDVEILVAYVGADKQSIEILCSKEVSEELLDGERTLNDMIPAFDIKINDIALEEDNIIDQIILKEGREDIIVLQLSEKVYENPSDTVALSYIGFLIRAKEDLAPLAQFADEMVINGTGNTPPSIKESYTSANGQWIYLELDEEIDKIEQKALEDFTILFDDMMNTSRIVGMFIGKKNTKQLALELDLFGTRKIDKYVEIELDFVKTLTKVKTKDGSELESFNRPIAVKNLVEEKVFLLLGQDQIRIITTESLGRIIVYDMNGHIKYEHSQKIFDKYFTVDISSYLNDNGGLYIICLLRHDGSVIMTRKFIY